jgi:hypothetical protein
MMDDGNREHTKDAARALIRRAAQSAALIPTDMVDDLISEDNMTDTLGPLIDPTAYRKVMRDVTASRQVLEAFRRFQDDVRKVTP